MAGTEYNYKSVLAPYIVQLMEQENATGALNAHLPGILKGFDHYACECGLADPHITEEFMGNWFKSRRNESDRTIYSKVSIWRKLLSLMNRRGCKCYVPKAMRSPNTTFTPYVFTEEELASIWHTIDNQKAYKNNADSPLMALPAIYRLLYSAGLRMGEALSIKNKDIDMERGTILIHATKRDAERIIVLHDTMKAVIQDYIRHRNRMPLSGITSPESHLFIKLDGTPVSDKAVYANFRKLLKKCGIEYGGQTKGPCVHSLRHTYAVHSLAKMTREGRNIYAALPILSASMGHHSLEATEYYVRLTRVTYADIENNSSAINAFVYPIVNQHYED